MKRSAGIFLCLLVLALGVFVVTRKQQTSPKAPASVTEQDGAEAASTADSSSHKRWNRAARREASESTAATSPVTAEPGTRAVVHQVADFARGQLQNLITADGLQLGNDVTYIPRFKPEFQRFGVLVSVEQPVEGGFDVVTPAMETAGSENGAVTIEIRTRAADGDWSVWREVAAEDFNKPIHMDTSAVAWQYRIYIFANDSSKSPIVKSVSVGTRKTGPATS